MTDTLPRTGAQDDVVRLHRLMTGYLSSKALFSALELGVFDALEKGPATAEELAARLGLPERSTRVLLVALWGEQLVERTDGQYRNHPAASAFLVSGSPRYMGSLATHQNTHFMKFAHLTDALRENKPVQLGENYSVAFGADWARHMANVTRVSALLMAENLAARIPLTEHRRLVDLGCASCVYSIAFARANPHLRVTGVDHPDVAAVGQEFVTAAGLEDRITVGSADIFADRFEGDVALISNLIQGYDSERAAALVAQVYSWLPEGGELLIHSHLPERAGVPFPYMFGLILLVNNTMGGEAHSEELHRQWLSAAGFRDVEVVEISPISAVVRARK